MKWLFKNYSHCLVAVLFSLFLFSSCRKLVETDPPSDRLTGESVFFSDATAIAAVTDLYVGAYDVLQGTSSASGISFYTGLSGDELKLYSGVSLTSVNGLYYTNALNAGPGGVQAGHDLWAPMFKCLFQCNSAIAGLSKSTSLTPLVKQQLLSEAKFMRAFYYFYLVNLYGDLPLILTTDPEVNTLKARSPKAEVYKQIIVDLEDAEESLSENFLGATLLTTTTERVRPTKWAATALLARVYLYRGEAGDYTKAEEKTNLIINNTNLFGPLPSLNNVFLKNNREAIWQLQSVNINFNTRDAQLFIIPPQGPSTIANPVYLSKSLLNSFEANDQRKTLGNWVDTTIYTVSQSPLVRDTVAYVNKYKINTSPGVNSPAGLTEYFMMFRLGEQYLIRAEARAQSGNVGGAQSDLNTIRTRAGLPNTTANDQASLLIAILNERRHELFCELGQRWFDLKRTGKIDQVMTTETPLKSNGTTTWKPYQALYPLPYIELQRGPNLVQNSGY